MDLDLYTDSAAMRTLLQQQLPGGFAEGRLRIDALGVHSARRNASVRRNPSPMTLCYDLQVTDTAGGGHGSQRLIAQVFRPGLAAAAWTLQDRGALVAPRFGQALAHVPALNLLLWALPNDPGLPQLRRLLDPVRAIAALPETLRPAAAAGGLRVELLRYAPNRRATLRCSFGEGAGQAAGVLYGKTFADARAADVDARFRWFWAQAQRDAQAPLVAEPLGVDVATRTAWQAAAVGEPLRSRLATEDAALWLGRVARALARLHDAPLAQTTTARPRSVAHWLPEVRRRQHKIGRAEPALAARAQRIAEAIEAHAAHPATRPLGLIHGDCHPEQFWLHDGRVVLFDFDEFTLGDPMEDLAEFVLKLEAAPRAAQLANTVIESYAAAAPERFDARSLAWHLAIQSLLQASRAFVYQQPGWAGELARRLGVAEAHAAALR